MRRKKVCFPLSPGVEPGDAKNPGAGTRSGVLSDAAGSASLKKQVYAFRVDGPLMGYRASLRRAFDPKWIEFKNRVKLLAFGAGCYGLDPVKEHLWLSVEIFWNKKPRVDWKNIVGGIEDAVFPHDRYVRPGVFSWHMNAGEEYAIVTVERG